MTDLPILGVRCHELMAQLCRRALFCRGPAPARVSSRERQRLIEEISALIIAELTTEGLTESDSDFLLDHAHSVQDEDRKRRVSRSARDDGIRGIMEP